MSDWEINWKHVAQEAEKVRDLALEAKAAAELARVKAEQERDAIRIVANGAISKLCDASFALHTGSQWDDELQSCHGGLSDYLIDRHNSARHALGYLRTVMQKIEQKPKVVQDEQAAQEAEQERDQAHERAANLAVELAAMTLSRDQVRQRARLWKAAAKQHLDTEWGFRRKVVEVCCRNITTSRMAEELRKELDQARQEADLLRRQVAAISAPIDAACSRFGHLDMVLEMAHDPDGTENTNPWHACARDLWRVAKAAKEGGGK